MYMYIHQVPIKRQINLPIIISQYNNYFFGDKKIQLIYTQSNSAH